MFVLQNLKCKLQVSIDNDEKAKISKLSRALTTAQADLTPLALFLSNSASLASMHHLQLGEIRAGESSEQSGESSG